MSQTIALVTKILSQWADWAGGYVQLLMFPSGMDYWEADIYQYPNHDHVYFRGPIDQVVQEVDEHLRSITEGKQVQENL